MNAAMSKRKKFKNWRMSRPFWGATLSLLAGLFILWIPLQLYAVAFAPGNFAFIGFLFGGLIIILAILGYIFPQFSIVFGVLTIFLAVLSIMGALGGLVIGTILGIIGGSLSIAWKKDVVPIKEADTGKEERQEIAATGDSGNAL
ncbi:DUF6114 domain-containing protein [Camelliibacillus cellulosilyticus]|uniref:DUF6114 domain-containing protein n=1 Tax=Camelliibacillus cellulosilyticus TaxID=2174486 RepID=A0ABV9GNJ7_9BACL